MKRIKYIFTLEIVLILFAFTNNKSVKDTCNFDTYLKDPKTPELAKRLFNGEKINIDSVDPSFLLDSLTAKNLKSRPFYFKVVENSYKSSDGAYSEGLGANAETYIENNTIEFVSYFDNKDCFTDIDLGTWADMTMLEFELEVDLENMGNNTSSVDDWTKQLTLNCKDCSASQKETLEKFSIFLKSKWQVYLKNINK